MQGVTRQIDITSDLCPMTYVRTRLALDKMATGETLLVILKGQEPLANIPRTATQQSHQVLEVTTDEAGISRLLIRRG